ncbi:MAG: O-antigen ligase family protein [Actinomycetota bacterium]|nr:O-antigen ligase family protein [Actinomycetota bacterium]
MRPTLVLVGIEAVLFLIAWLIARRRLPHTALALIAMTAPLEVYRTPVLDLNLSLFRLAVLIGAGVVLAGPARRCVADLLRDPVVWVYAALLALMVVSLLVFSQNRDLGFRVMSQVAIGIVVVVVVAALVQRIDDPPVAMALLLCGIALPVAAACWQAIAYSAGTDATLPGLGDLPAAAGLEGSREGLSFVGTAVRLKATFSDPNHFGAFAALMTGPCLGVLAQGLHRRSRVTVTAAAALAAALGCMVFASSSRSAMLALAVCILGVAVLSGTSLLGGMSSRGRVLSGAVAVVICAGIAIAALPLLQQRLDPSAAANVESNRTHQTTLSRAGDNLVAEPLVGIGLADFGPQLGEGPRTSGAHSTYLTVGAELGGAGLILLLLAIAATARLMVAGVRRARGPLGELSVGLACGYAGFVLAAALYDLWWDDFHWVAVGVGLGLLAPVAPFSIPRVLRRLAPRPPTRLAR